MVEYPYGRSGKPICYYEDEVSEEMIVESADTGDNEVKWGYDDNDEKVKAYLYEAPAEDDPGRGHYSEWGRKNENVFVKTDGVTGDDGMCYYRLEESVYARMKD